MENIKTSKSFSLNTVDVRAFLRNVVIWYSPVFIMLLDQIQSGQLDISIIYALSISLTVDLIRRFLKDYSKINER